MDRNACDHVGVIAIIVALLAEGVDRNFAVLVNTCLSFVALLAEGVDRNVKRIIATPERTIVALLAEGVDRNFIGKLAENKDPMSPSSRRAWIEICSGYAPRA